MKVVGEAPTGRSRRLIVTERGISYRGRPPGKRSAHSSREGNGSPGRTRRSSTGRRGTGSQTEAATRYARCGEPEWGWGHLLLRGDKIDCWRAKWHGNGHASWGSGRLEKGLETVPRQSPTQLLM